MSVLKPEDALNRLIERARAAGAERVDVTVYAGEALDVGVRQGELEDLTRSESRKAGLRVLIGERAGFASTEDFARGALDETAEAAVALAKVSPPDPFARQAAEDRMGAGEPIANLADALSPEPDTLIDRALTLEGLALDKPEIASSEGSGAAWSKGQVLFGDDRGVALSFSAGRHAMGVSVLAERDGKKERGGESRSARLFHTLPALDEVGADAAERARNRLGAVKPKSFKGTVIFEARPASQILGAIAGAAKGGAIARGVSWLKDKVGERITPAGIDIVDEPRLPAGLGSRPFDGEGVRTQTFHLLKDGVLQGYLHNAASAAQLGEALTGHAGRSFGAATGISTSNLDLRPGTLSLEALMADIDHGLFIEGMFGPSINQGTGDFSIGVHGRMIVKGKLDHAFSEATVAGNLLDILPSLTAADDFQRRGATNSPSLRLDAVTIAGR